VKTRAKIGGEREVNMSASGKDVTNEKQFVTSYGRTIPCLLMMRVARELQADRDWQDVATRLLRNVIPDHDDDLEELNEVLAEAEARAEVLRIEGGD